MNSLLLNDMTHATKWFDKYPRKTSRAHEACMFHTERKIEPKSRAKTS